MGEFKNKMQVVIVSLSAKSLHKTLAPWCLRAYCQSKGLNADVQIIESNINHKLEDVVSRVLPLSPKVAAFSCYIWNIEMVRKLAAMIKKLLPSCIIVFGGPEVSFEKETSSDFHNADYIIRGAGERAFYQLMQSFLEDKPLWPGIVAIQNDPFPSLPTPYTEDYFFSFEQDKTIGIGQQLIYYESSRGCPFFCAYCLSSATQGVEYLPIYRVKEDIEKLLSRGAKVIKFVDRTFNADRRRALAMWEYIRQLDTGCTFHFEVAGDLFSDDMLSLIKTMPVARAQFEIGIQSVNPETLAAVSRKTNTEKALCNIKQLTGMGNCHVHVDLIAGMPHDTARSFGQAVDRCLAVHPHMLQLGFLKLLKGSRLREAAAGWECIYSDAPPYEILQNSGMSFAELWKFREIEKVVDKFYNSGMFEHSIQYGIERFKGSGFAFFSAFAKFVHSNGGVRVSLKNAYDLLYRFLLQEGAAEKVSHVIKLDCLLHDPKGMLPDGISACRNKDMEYRLKKSQGFPYRQIRAEYFPFDGQTRLFLYECKNPVDNRYDVHILKESDGLIDQAPR